MKIGIIAEGKADLAVVTNILKGILDIDRSDIIYIQPENYYKLSKFFRKTKNLNKFLLKNKSLEIFCSDLQKQKKDCY